MRVARPIVLKPEQKEALEQCARARSLPVRLVERARIVLLAAAGRQDKEVAAELGITAHKAARWRQRFLAAGMVGLEKDAPRPGRTPSISPAKVQRVIHKTTQEKPAHATHWSTRSMAAAVGLSEATVRRIWHRHGLKPHLMETFKVSTDPHFAEKLEAIVGLILVGMGVFAPSERAALTDSNVNLYCGLVMLAFGLIMLGLSRLSKHEDS